MNPQAQPFVPTQHTWTDDNGVPELLTAARRLLVTSAWHGAVVRKQKDKSTWVIPASSRHGSAPSLTSASRSAAAKGESSPWAHIDSVSSFSLLFPSIDLRVGRRRPACDALVTVLAVAHARTDKSKNLARDFLSFFIALPLPRYPHYT